MDEAVNTVKKENEEGSKGLGNRSAKGFFWMFSGSIGQALMRLVYTGVLSRLLLPGDFGIITIATMVTGFAQLFVELGVGSALVQKKEIDDTHINTAFTFSLLSAILMMCLFYAANPLLAAFFHEPKLVNVLNILVWIFPIDIVSRVSYSLLQRNLKFKKLAGNAIISNFIGFGLIGIPLAYFGYGFYSLIWANLTQSIIYTLTLFYHQPHSIKLKIDRAALKDLSSFGSRLTASKIFNYWALNGDYFIVSRVLGTISLGYYSRAYRLMGLVNTIFGSVMDTVLFPSFTRIQDDTEKITATLDRGFAILLWLFLPVSVFASLLAPEMINILFGGKWNMAIVPFQILSLGIFFRIGYKLAASFLKGCGFIKFVFNAQVVYFVSVVLFAYLGSFFNITGVAVGVTISLLITFVSHCNFAIKKSGYTWALFLSRIKYVLLYTFIIMCIVTPVVWVLRLVHLPALVIAVCGFSVITAATFFTYSLKLTSGIFDEHIKWFIDKLRGGLLKKGKKGK